MQKFQRLPDSVHFRVAKHLVKSSVPVSYTETNTLNTWPG